MSDQRKETGAERLLFDEHRVWKTSDVAQFLGCSERMVQDLASVSKIPHMRLGRLLRFSEDSVRKWFASQQVGGEAQGPVLTDDWWQRAGRKNGSHQPVKKLGR